MRKIGFAIYPGYQPMGFAVTSPIEITNQQAAAEPVYDIRLLSKAGVSVRTSVGFEVITEPFSEETYALLRVPDELHDRWNPASASVSFHPIKINVTMPPRLMKLINAVTAGRAITEPLG